MLRCSAIGTTNTVLATFDGDKLVHDWRIKTDARSTADELGLMFRGLLAGDAVEVTGVAACSTVPAALRSLRTMLARYYADLPNVIVEAGVKTGVQLAIDNPKEVGADRVVNTLAAHALYRGVPAVGDVFRLRRPGRPHRRADDRGDRPGAGRDRHRRAGRAGQGRVPDDHRPRADDHADRAADGI